MDPEDLPKLRAVVQRRSASHLNYHDVEDIVSDVLVAAAVTYSRPGVSASFAQLAFGYAKKTDFYERAARRASRRQTATTLSRRDDDAGPTPPDPAAPGDLTDDAAVRDVLRRLPEAERAALLEYYAAGSTLVEASAALGVPVRTLQRRLDRARASFMEAWA